MKALMMGLLITCFSFVALADEWPYDPACRNNNAISETMTVKSFTGQTRKVVFCVFGAGSYIDTTSLEASIYKTLAVSDYTRNVPDPFTEDCGYFGARAAQGIDSAGKNYRLCEWGDRSMMEKETFKNGPRSGWNSQMDWALGIY